MELPPRTYLFVPGNRPERFLKALATGADAVILDLEDAVAPDDKPAARDAVGAFIASTPPGDRSRLLVRINDDTTSWFTDDLAMLARCQAAVVMLPKAEQTEVLSGLRKLCPQLGVLALVETARGVLNAPALAAAEGVVRLAFGTIDFAADLGLSGDALGFDHAASVLALASRAAGLPPPVAGSAWCRCRLWRPRPRRWPGPSVSSRPLKAAAVWCRWTARWWTGRWNCAHARCWRKPKRNWQHWVCRLCKHC